MATPDRLATTTISVSAIVAVLLAVAGYALLPVPGALPLSFVVGGAAVLVGTVVAVNARRLGQRIWWLGVVAALLGLGVLVVNTLV